MRVLIVDDEETVRATLAANLELEGFEVLEAKNAAQAIALVEQQAVDLVLSDIRMPGMNGVDLFRCIRKVQPQLPVVLMTAFALEALIEDAFREGVFTILSKPFEIDHLLSILTRAASRPLVLLVDAADGGAATLQAMQAAGVKCGLASQPDAMLRMVREKNVDVCIVNLASAPSGMHVASQIRTVAPATAIIGVVPAADVELAQNLAHSDAYAYINEPYEPVELVRLIAKARGRPAPATSSTQTP